MDRRIAALVLLASGFAIALGFHFGTDRATPERQAAPSAISHGPAPLRIDGVVVEARALSAQCRVASAPFEGHAPLPSVRRALMEQRPARIVSLGPSSVLSADTSSPIASYPSELERDLEASGVDVEIIARTQEGAVAGDAAERLKAEVTRLRPDLLVWQVGTNDAVARLDADGFADRLRETLGWLASHKIDVVLVDPQYVARLSDDEGYTGIVDRVAAVASEKHVLRVNRYDAMADLARTHPSWSHLTADRFRLSDMGYRCAAEYTADAIVAGVNVAAKADGGLTR
ncbi:GDSL family lipase [Hyphomicrobium nitrativorans NL23]|uniref:GDSL family lipase n=1 Tax=Hyphomicrobium nitrativorans NL23 TaxID=1029756 RepID=V5SFJ9_9HYPH|nr:SGNH/GDSL hydrolase family protein [Hyphomicrobium nitrativorans]AHB49671.1 GDSL family lipase [Hyphomicrobium nitrativorans NL23]